MEKLVRFSASDLAKVTSHRSGEIKFGEKMITLPPDADAASFLKSSDAKFVIFGIPEDIGIRANFGRPGAATSWDSAIRSIANIQHNRFCKGSRIIVLGTLDVAQAMKKAKGLDFLDISHRMEFTKLVESIDKDVAHIISIIVKSGKIPIVIGGGHNNAYGNIKGTALAKGKPVNAINLDAHSDFRILEGRHSGNGFSYAFDHAFLKRYFIFGLHENYTSKNVLDILKKIDDSVRYNTYDEIAVRGDKDFEEQMEEAHDFIGADPYGIEIDLDAIPFIPSSAMTSSGFSVKEVRKFVHYFGQFENAAWLHICEGAPDLGEEKNSHLTGKLIGYLITDFIKASPAV